MNSVGFFFSSLIVNVWICMAETWKFVRMWMCRRLCLVFDSYHIIKRQCIRLDKKFWLTYDFKITRYRIYDFQIIMAPRLTQPWITSRAQPITMLQNVLSTIKRIESLTMCTEFCFNFSSIFSTRKLINLRKQINCQENPSEGKFFKIYSCETYVDF